MAAVTVWELISFGLLSAGIGLLVYALAMICFLNHKSVWWFFKNLRINKSIRRRKKKADRTMKILVDFLKKNYPAQDAAEASCHIGDIRFPLVGPPRQFVCLADNVYIKPVTAALYNMDEGPYQNVVYYKAGETLRLFICGRVMLPSEVEEPEALLEEFGV